MRQKLRYEHLCNIDLSCVHELQNSSQVVERNILEDDNWVLGWVLLQQVLEVWRAGTENHLVSLGVLPLGGDCHIAKGFLISEMLEGGDHVCLKVIPPETKLLIIARHLELGSRQRSVIIQQIIHSN